MGEKTEATKWFFLVMGGFVLLVLLGGGFMIFGKRVEREVLVQSHQYREGMADRAGVLRASIAELDTRILSGTLDATTRSGLEAQRSALNIQLNAIRR